MSLAESQNHYTLGNADKIYYTLFFYAWFYLLYWDPIILSTPVSLIWSNTLSSFFWGGCQSHLDFLTSIPTSLFPKIQLSIWVSLWLVWSCDDKDKQRIHVLISGLFLMSPQSRTGDCPCATCSCSSLPSPWASETVICINVSQLGQYLWPFLTDKTPLLPSLCSFPYLRWCLPMSPNHVGLSIALTFNWANFPHHNVLLLLSCATQLALKVPLHLEMLQETLGSISATGRVAR